MPFYSNKQVFASYLPCFSPDFNHEKLPFLKMRGTHKQKKSSTGSKFFSFRQATVKMEDKFFLTKHVILSRSENKISFETPFAFSSSLPGQTLCMSVIEGGWEGGN